MGLKNHRCEPMPWYDSAWPRKHLSRGLGQAGGVGYLAPPESGKGVCPDRVRISTKDWTTQMALSAHAIQGLRCDSAMARPNLRAVGSARKPLTQLLHRLARIEADCALPNHSHTPTFSPQGSYRRRVALLVRVQLGIPELGSGLRKSKKWAIRMPMPETSMHKYHRPPFREHEVRLAGESFRMKAKAESSCPELSAHNHLRPCVLCPDSRHQR